VPNFYHLIRQAIRFLEIVGNDPAIVARPATAKAGTRQRSVVQTRAKASAATN
jgi:hypothetical protein